MLSMDPISPACLRHVEEHANKLNEFLNSTQDLAAADATDVTRLEVQSSWRTIDTKECLRQDLECLESNLGYECTANEIAVHGSACHLVMTK